MAAGGPLEAADITSQIGVGTIVFKTLSWPKFVSLDTVAQSLLGVADDSHTAIFLPLGLTMWTTIHLPGNYPVMTGK